MCEEKWGVGKEANSKAFNTTAVGGEQVHLIHGEHPHSRQDNNTYARFQDGSIEGFSGHWILTEVSFEDFNYLKTSSLTGNEVRKGGTCKIRLNQIPVYEFFYREISEALLKARDIVNELKEHPLILWNPESKSAAVGRKVYWDNQPAKIVRLIQNGSVILEPDYPDGSDFRPITYMIDSNEEFEDRNIKDSVLSSKIYWFRQ